MIKNKKGRGKNSGKMVGEIAQVDLIMFEWFYKKVPVKELQCLFNISEATINKIVKTYGFKPDEHVRLERKRENIRKVSVIKKGKESKIFKDRTGEVFKTNQGYKVKIIKYESSAVCEIQFLDEHGLKYKASYASISKGLIHHPFHRTVYGVGFLGDFKFKKRDDSRALMVWKSMMGRAYSDKVKKRQPRYKDCCVSEEWHNFQNFKRWYIENFKSYMGLWHLDKDILIKGNKTYSPETCCFVPRDINLLFTKQEKNRGDLPIGVFKDNGKLRVSLTKFKKSVYFSGFSTPAEAFNKYKEEKEKYIKEVADKWKDLIDIKVYEAMYNYKVEITD